MQLTTKTARNASFGLYHAERSAFSLFVMLNEVKHPCTGFLASLGMTTKTARNDKEKGTE